jgi:hypothetical protein
MKAIDKGEQEGCLACSDISLWEIADRLFIDMSVVIWHEI